MTYKEILDKVTISKSFFNEIPAFVIVKNRKDNLLEVSASRPLTDNEIMGFTITFIDYFLAKGTTEIVNTKTGETWRFSKELKNDSN